MASRSERTQAQLQQTALRLFSERGFDEVTVEEIAATAGVSHMTFYRHFPTKESVVLDDPYDPVIGEAVAGQDRELPPLQRVRMGFLEVLGQMDSSGDDAVRIRVRLAIDNPSLRARIWENNHRTESVIVSALATTGVAERDAAVAAGAVLGATTAALLDWAGAESEQSLSAALSEALGHLGVGEEESRE